MSSTSTISRFKRVSGKQISVPPLVETNPAETRTILRRRLEKIDAPASEKIDLYQSLNKLLGSGNNDRFVLYCPINLIPSVDEYRRHGPVVDTFTELYLQSFFRLLHVHDVQAHFVNGDVPDIELGVESLEMITQAAYLIPTLIQKGLISLNQLNIDDKTFHKSLKLAMAPVQTVNPPPWAPAKIASTLANNDPKHTSEKRTRWLQWERRRQIIESFGRSLARELVTGHPTPTVHEPKSPLAEIILHGIGYAIEELPTLYTTLETDLHRLAEHQDATSILCRLNNSGAISDETFSTFGVQQPCLEGPLHQNIKNLPERPRLDDIRMRNGHFFFDAVVIYGSRLKGYGEPDADLDIGVFIKPDIDYQTRGYIDSFLFDQFGQTVTQYWLQEDGHVLRVLDPPRPAANLGNSMQAHVLLGGAWEGNSATIDMLREKLLKPYCLESNSEVRKVWLRELERNFLLYRLLHRGYERFNVVRGPIFLDHGYRSCAAKLYASHVQIPKFGEFS